MLVPAQTVPLGFALMFMVGMREELTVMVILFEIAVVGFAQVAFEVISQVIASPLESEVVP